MKKGVTVIEIIIVIAILAIVATTASPFFSNLILRINLTNTTNNLISTIRKAQEYATNGKDGVTWGFCQAGSSIRLFATNCNSPTYSEDYSIPSSVLIAGITETTFSPLRGEPSAIFSIIVSTSLKTTTITMNLAGGLDIN